jgi:hypothetical protein
MPTMAKNKKLISLLQKSVEGVMDMVLNQDLNQFRVQHVVAKAK